MSRSASPALRASPEINQGGLIPAWTVDDASGPIAITHDDYEEKQSAPRMHDDRQMVLAHRHIAKASSRLSLLSNRPPNSHANSYNRQDSTISSRSTQTFAGLPRLNYRLYSPPLFTLSEDCKTLSSRATHLSTDAAELASFMRAQASIPPKPQVLVQGTRRTGKVDFEIRLNLMSLLVPEEARMRTDYVRCVGDDDLALRGGQKPALMPRVGDGGLEEWCRLFVEDPADVKSFTMERKVANLDELWIEGQLRSLVNSTGYKGKLNITFPTTHSHVVVKSAHKKYVTSMKNMFKPKALYEVVQAMWPFATTKIGVEGRQCVVQSEEAWWKEWRDPIKYAVATKRQGWVTNEDKLEALMEGKGRGVQPIDWEDEAD